MTTRRVVHKRPPTAQRAVAEFRFNAGDVHELSLALQEPAWLLERRMQAWALYQATPMPALHDEAWRRTDLRRLPADRVALKPARPDRVPPELVAPLVAEQHGALLVISPGHPAQIQVPAAMHAQGVVVADWRRAVSEHGGLLRRHLDRAVGPKEGKFAALAAALAENGALVYIPAGVQLEDPVHIVLWAPGARAAFFSRLLVVMEQGASATVVFEAASPTDDEETVHAGIVELQLADDARLRLVELQNWGRHVWNFTHERARLGRDAALEWVFGAVGSRLTKNFSEINLAGRGAEGRMSGFYFADGIQHLDHDTQQNHLAPHTTSDLLFKGALKDRSRSVWRGMIYVARGAQKTDGYQANRNLLLSKGARADSIPGLEILADDVRCTHGATVSQLEQEPIFYLMTRGLPRPMAERLVVEGFFAPVLDRIPFEGVRKRFMGMIDQKMIA